MQHVIACNTSVCAHPWLLSLVLDSGLVLQDCWLLQQDWGGSMTLFSPVPSMSLSLPL